MKPIPAKALGLPRMTAANALSRDDAYAMRRAAKQTRGKYGNQPTSVQGIEFDSKAEARRYIALQAMEKAGEISDLQRQVVFELAPSVTVAGRKRPPLRYLADFTYRAKDGTLTVEDVKGAVTDAYRIKRHLMAAVHGIEVKEIRSS